MRMYSELDAFFKGQLTLFLWFWRRWPVDRLVRLRHCPSTSLKPTVTKSQGTAYRKALMQLSCNVDLEPGQLDTTVGTVLAVPNLHSRAGGLSIDVSARGLTSIISSSMLTFYACD